ncbi:MAG: hypothetical protein OEZ04_04170 [Nitrospinota bacterium]|nr:hypothetical protein [Nitrospinota bacterium]
MKRLTTIITALLMVALTWVAPTWAADHKHMHGDMHGEPGMSKSMDSDKKSMSGMFMTTKEINGYKVSFHVMKASGGMKHDDSHNLMVKVEKGGAPVSGLIANSKVIHPDGTEESKKLMQMGDWMMAGYDLGHKGKHQLMILFKTADGKKHFGGVFYP